MYDDKLENPYFHDYGKGFQFHTNTEHSNLESYLEWRQKAKYLEPLSKAEIASLVVFPNAYNCHGNLIPGCIAICRRIDDN